MSRMKKENVFNYRFFHDIKGEREGESNELSAKNPLDPIKKFLKHFLFLILYPSLAEMKSEEDFCDEHL